MKGDDEPPSFQFRAVAVIWGAEPAPPAGPEIPDFRKVNKNAAKSGIANAKQLAGYRREGGDVMLVAQSQAAHRRAGMPFAVLAARYLAGCLAGWPGWLASLLELIAYSLACLVICLLASLFVCDMGGGSLLLHAMKHRIGSLLSKAWKLRAGL